MNPEISGVKKLIFRLWHHLPQHRKLHVIYLLLLMLLASVAELVSIGLVIPFLSVLTNPSLVLNNDLLAPIFFYFSIYKPEDIFLPVTFMFVLAALFAGFIRALLIITQTKVGYLTGAELGVKIFSKTLYQSYENHLQNNTSQIIAGISHKTTALVQNGIIAILTIISSLLILISIISVLLFINFRVSMITFLIFGLIYSLMMIFTKSSLEEKGRLVNKMQVSVVKKIQEGLGAIRDILIDSSQQVFIDAFKKSEFKLRHSQVTHIILSTTPKFIVESLGIAMIAIIAYLLMIDNNSTINVFTTLGALALGAQRLLPILQQLYANWSSFSAGKASFNDALDLLDQKEKIKKNNAKSLKFKNKITLKNISFKYLKSKSIVLNKVNLEIPFGSRIGIMGSTGSGKSTMLDIIMSLLEPRSGKIYVDKTLINSKNSHLWKSMIAHVPQTIYLSDATISENIAFGILKENIDSNKLKKVIELAQLSSTISKLSKGLDTIVGERGARLSGGQRQRIGIARALYKGAKMIIFDEATSALDSNTEKKIMKSIFELPKEITILIVSHRESALKECDKLYKLEKSKLVDTFFNKK